VFDSDIYTKPNVAAALKALYQFLRSKHARPGLVQWPEAYRQGKTGVDDYFSQGHSLAELLAMVPPIGPLPARFFPRRNGTTPDTPAPLLSAEERALPLSDYTNALHFVREHGQDLRYCYPWNAWLVWQKTHWERDTTGEVMRRAKQTVTRLARDIEHLTNEKAIAALLAHIKSSLSTAKLEALVRNAQSEPGMQVQPTDLDTNVWLLNCLNGTIDLQTGEIRGHSQADFITKCLPTAYDKEATCPTWDAFLWRIMGGSQGADDPDTMSALDLENRQHADERARTLIAYLQEAVGYTLTGSTREQCLFILYGITKTGKSTFLAVLRALLDAYGTQAQMRTFMYREREEVRNDLADLAGARMVCAVESTKGARLDEGLVKQLTGGVDTIKARFLFQEHFTFRPQFKVFLATNHSPDIRDMDDAIWERIRRIPFDVQIPKEERDKTLEDQLLQELPGVLVWAVEGCRRWQAHADLREPEAVQQSTVAYRTEMDTVQRFIEDCCLVDDTVRVKMGDFYTAYQKWCEAAGEWAESLKEVGKRLDTQGFEKKVSNGVWRLRLGLTQAEQP
jgi:putative DNA primase/helicase